MILDSLANASVYRSLSPGIAAALDFLSRAESWELPPGRHALEDDRLFAVAMTYTTKPPHESFWEAHRRYIDVQFIVSGVETMRYAPIQTMAESKPYDVEKDFSVYEGCGQSLIVGEHQFAIFWPHDVHMPSLMVATPSTVKKIVVKVAVE